MNSIRALLLDIGNTRIKWGLAHGANLQRTGTVTHQKLRDAGIAALTTRLPRRVEQVLACNVAGNSVATKISGIIHLHCDTDTHFVHPARSGYGITNAYGRPRRLGVDRWVAMIGAYAEFSAALCVIDAGTAVTIDAVDRKGKHLGGQIIPGLRLMQEALTSATDGIVISNKGSRSTLDGLNLFAKNTTAAVRNGTVSAVCGAIERSVRRLKKEGHRPRVIVTGGDAPRILNQVDVKFDHRPNLVLQGLAYMSQSER
ncbi:MAG: type III pantothenate kinase [Gammaproteobacteria bacterium]|nr:type III pantothenate kinase [Gammaproteobacteria bacterium]